MADLTPIPTGIPWDPWDPDPSLSHSHAHLYCGAVEKKDPVVFVRTAAAARHIYSQISREIFFIFQEDRQCPGAWGYILTDKILCGAD